MLPQKKVPLKALVYGMFQQTLTVHGGQYKFFKILGNRNQVVVDHNVLGVDGINVVNVDNVGFMGPIELVLWQFFQIIL